jgi:hypothetical protein
VAVCDDAAAGRVVDAMRDAFAAVGSAGPAFVARPDMHGAQPRDIGTLRESLSAT